MSNFWEMEALRWKHAPWEGSIFFPPQLHSGTNGLMERFDLHANYKSSILTILITIGQCLNDIIDILYDTGTIKKWSNLENLIKVYRCFIGDHHYLDFILCNFPFIVIGIIYVENLTFTDLIRLNIQIVFALFVYTIFLFMML